MSATKVSSLLFAASTIVPAGTSRGGPVISNVIDLRTAYGGAASVKVTNGSSGPAIGCTIEAQTSADGTLWSYFDSMTGDVLASSGGTATFVFPVAAGYARCIAYGNTGSAVTVDGQINIVTGL